MPRPLKVVNKPASQRPRFRCRPTPDPRPGTRVESGGRLHGRLVDLVGVGEGLTGQRFPPEDPPPGFLEVEPARCDGDERVLDPGMVEQPFPGGDAVVAGGVVGDHVDVTGRVRPRHQLQKPLVVRAVTRGGGQGDSLSVTHADCGPQVVSGPREYAEGALVRCPSPDQPGAGGNVRGTTGPSSSAQTTVELSGGVVWRPMIRCPFGTNSGSRLVDQERVRHQRTPSARRMRRT